MEGEWKIPYFDVSGEHAERVVQRAFRLVENLLCGSAQYDGARLACETSLTHTSTLTSRDTGETQ
jgi:hypothetical protein